MGFSSKKSTHPSCRRSRPGNARHSGDHASERDDVIARRIEKLTELLGNTTAIENGLIIPDTPVRYVALEQSIFGDTLWAYFDDLMTGIMQQIEASDTSFVDRIRVHDLDTALIYAPKWTVDSLYEVPS